MLHTDTGRLIVLEVGFSEGRQLRQLFALRPPCCRCCVVARPLKILSNERTTFADIEKEMPYTPETGTHKGTAIAMNIQDQLKSQSGHEWGAGARRRPWTWATSLENRHCPVTSIIYGDGGGQYGKVLAAKQPTQMAAVCSTAEIAGSIVTTSGPLLICWQCGRGKGRDLAAARVVNSRLGRSMVRQEQGDS